MLGPRSASARNAAHRLRPMLGPWWQHAVVYQVYPRSYADSNGDGIGDLPGVVSRLDHLEWLGVDAVWLSPTFPSPNADWGYDVADYLGVHPDLGTPADLERLLVEAERATSASCSTSSPTTRATSIRGSTTRRSGT